MTLELSHEDTSKLLDLITELNEMYSNGYTAKDKKIKDLCNRINLFIRERGK